MFAKLLNASDVINERAWVGLRMSNIMKLCASIPLCICAFTATASAQPQTPPAWPQGEDIVRAEPVAISRSAAGRPDVTRFLLVRSAGQFVLSPDGTRVAYVSEVTGQPQIWTVPATGGFPDQLTYAHGVDWLEASPDGRHLLYGADDGGDERVAITLLSYDGTSDRTLVEKSAAFRVFGAFSSDGGRVAYSSTERNGTDFDIYVADVATGKTRRVYQGRYGFYVDSWQPGGDLLAVRETRGEIGNDLHLLDTRTGRLVKLFAPRRASTYEHISWKPDGSGFYLSTNQNRDHTAVQFYDLRSRRLHSVSAPPHDIAQLEISRDGRYLAWTTIETGFERLHVRDLRTGRDIPVPALPDGTTQFQFAADAPVLGLRIVSPRTAGQIYVWKLESNDVSLAVPVDAAGLDMTKMTVPEPISFTSRDGVMLTGLLYMPERPLGGARPPVYLSLHGGPSGHATPDYDPLTQYLVARGIAVLDFNYRGSTGHGRAYAELNDGKLKADEAGDLADAVGWLRSTGRVDASRVAIGGASYGGYLTNLALGTYPGMFLAGVSMVGVSDWVSALEGASPALKASDRLEYGDISDPRVRQFFQRLSPINNADRIRTPLMVLHGANDPRDPVSESDRFVEKIRRAGGKVVYLRFPDEGHGISRLANRVHAYRRIATFLGERFVGSKTQDKPE